MKLTLFYKHSQASPTSPSKQIYSTQTVTVYPEPQTEYTYTPQEVWVGEEIAFDSAPSVEGIEEFERFEWDFGDGTEVVSGATTTHTFAAPNVYTVTLTAFTESSSFDVDHEITVDLAPSAEFTVTPTTGDALYTAFLTLLSMNSRKAPGQYVLMSGILGMKLEQVRKKTPDYRYPKTGAFEPSLTVHYRHSLAENGAPDLTAMATQSVIVTASIYDYISEDDGCYSYSTPRVQSIVLSEGSYEEKVATAYLVDEFVSQCWNPDDAVYSGYEEWTHPVIIMVPDYKTSDDALLLLVDGGNRESEIGDDEIDLYDVLVRCYRNNL